MSASANWFCVINGQQFGPVTFDLLKQMATTGQLTAQTLVCRPGDPSWIPAAQVPGLFPVQPAVVAPRAAPAPMATAIPVVAEPPVAPAMSLNTSSPKPRPSAASKTRRKAKSKFTQQQLLIGGGSLGGLVLVGVLIAVLMSGGQKPKETAQNKPAPENEPAPAAAAASTNPEDDPASQTVKPAQPQAAPAAAKAATPAKTDNREAVLSTISQWRDASTVSTGLAGLVKVKVARVWQSGTPRSADPSLITPVENESEPSYLFIELSVTNSGRGPLNYSSWNGFSASQSHLEPILVDNANAFATLLTRTESPATSRLVSAEIPPGDSVTDLLVFKVPSSKVDWWHLALPFAAVGKGKHAGFEIKKFMVNERKSAEPTNPLAAADPAGDKPPPLKLTDDPDKPPPLKITDDANAEKPPPLKLDGDEPANPNKPDADKP